jgi:uncharacterized damage-inducible protein DinB
MKLKDTLTEGWDLTQNIEGWYPPLNDALKNVTHDQATWSAPGNASNTIEQIVNHLLYYKKRFLFRLEGKNWNATIRSNDETFSAMNEISSLPWEQLVAELSSVNKQIRDTILKLSDGDLDLNLPDQPIGKQILNLIMHDAYHTGQIVFIRKLQGSWPAVRDT